MVDEGFGGCVICVDLVTCLRQASAHSMWSLRVTIRRLRCWRRRNAARNARCRKRKEGVLDIRALQGAKDGLRGWRFIRYAVSLGVLVQNASYERQVQLNMSFLAETGDFGRL